MTPLPGRSRTLLAGIAALSFAFAACADGGVSPAAVVEGTTITQQRLDDAIPEFRFLSALNQAPCGEPVGGESEDAACARFTLSNLIQEELIGSFARENEISVPSDLVTSTIADLEEQVGADALADRLAAQSLTPEDLQRFVGRLLLFQQVQQAVTGREVPEAEVRRAYAERELEFTRMHAKHILVETRQEAAKIARRATPDTFEALAKRFSIEPGVGQSGGDLGDQQASSFDAGFAEAALALEPGEISDPVHTRFGWHVILLVSAERAPFSQVRGQLLQELGPTAFADWFVARFREADIDVNPRYGRLDPQTQLLEPVRTTSTSSPTPSPTPTGPVEAVPGAGASPQG